MSAMAATVLQSALPPICGTAPPADNGCARCDYTGWEFVPGRGSRLCSCRQRQQLAKRLADAQIPARYAAATLTNFELAGRSPQVQQAHQQVRQYVQDLLDSQGLLLVGPVGTGKTHLAAAVLRAVIETRHFTGRFAHLGDLAKSVQMSWDDAVPLNEHDLLRPVFETGLLVLDELGGDAPTAWRQNFAARLIEARYERKQPLIVTTNCPLGEARGEFLPLAQHIGTRAESRLREMCKVVNVQGQDFRRELQLRQMAE